MFDSCQPSFSEFLSMFHSQKSSKIFGGVEDVCDKYKIDRGGEIHTKHLDVPTPSKSRFLIDDELEPSRYIHMEFEEIHDSYYIGINDIVFYDAEDNPVPYTNIEVDGKEVDNETVKPAFPVDGWWAVRGENHSLVFDFGAKTHIKHVFMWCANAASTPKMLKVSDGKKTVSHESNNEDAAFSENSYIQLGGNRKKNPSALLFIPNGKQATPGIYITCTDIVHSLNKIPPSNGFESFFTKCGCHFVFYKKGLRTRVCDYFFGKDHSVSVQLLNSITSSDGVTIDNVANRAMTLDELRAVRALIVSNCTKKDWKSSWDGTKLRPEDVNLYDLNAILIKPLTTEKNCSFKELFPSGISSPTYYVSHWWGEKVLDFIRCCEYHAIAHDLQNPKYWVCAYANRQNDLGTDLGTDPSKSSFNLAMKKAEGVFLVIDPNVVVTSRIWVDFELYRTIKTRSMLDVGIYSEGKVHLIADKALPHETPYQKNRREKKFPFKQVCEKFLTLKLHRGEASQLIDKVRILNVMSNNTENLDDGSIIKRIDTQNALDPKYVKEMEYFMRSDSSLRATLASKAVSVALSTDNQSLNNFYGHDLFDIIASDGIRSELILDDLPALDSVTDEIFLKLIAMVGPNIEKFVLNVCGCKNLTSKSITKMKLPQTLTLLSLNVGYAKNITNDALLHLAKVIPQNLESLDLDVSGFKMPDGCYLPLRHNNLLKRFASNMPPLLKSYRLVLTLADSEDVSGLKIFAGALPRKLQEFTLVLEAWEGYKSEYFPKMVGALPQSLETLSITQHGGAYFKTDDLKIFAQEVKTKLVHLKGFYLHTSDNGVEFGGYSGHHITSVEELMTYA